MIKGYLLLIISLITCCGPPCLGTRIEGQYVICDAFNLTLPGSIEEAANVVNDMCGPLKPVYVEILPEPFYYNDELLSGIYHYNNDFIQACINDGKNNCKIHYSIVHEFVHVAQIYNGEVIDGDHRVRKYWGPNMIGCNEKSSLKLRQTTGY